MNSLKQILGYESLFESELLEQASEQLKANNFTKSELQLSLLYLVSLDDPELQELIADLCSMADLGLRFYFTFFANYSLPNEIHIKPLF